MSSSLKKAFAFAAGGCSVLLVVSALFLLMWARDVQNDRKHTVSVNTITPVFTGDGAGGGCHGIQLAKAEHGDKLLVRRIRYLKDCAAIDVVLPDGRRGYLVVGVGDFAVDPPLPTT